MKIAFVQDDWWPQTGGGPTHVRALSIALAKQFGHEIDIYTRSVKEDGIRYDDSEEYVDGAVTVYRVSPCTEYWNTFGRVSSIITPVPYLVAGNYDIVHGHTFLPAVPTRLSKTMSNSAIVFTVHGTALNSGVGRDESAIARFKRQMEKQFILGFDYDKVISVNREHMNLLTQHHNEVTYIPNGVNLGRFDVDVDQSDDILFLGRLAPKKRASDLIRAFSKIADEFPKSDLIIVGTGPKQDHLVELATNLGISNRVSFEGRVSEDAIPRYYASAAVFVLPSIWEGHPLTLLEAWAAGTPVVATEVEGIEEFIDHRKTGFLSPPKSPDRLSDALRYVLTNRTEANSWAERARAVVEQEYSWERAAKKTHEAYCDIT